MTRDVRTYEWVEPRFCPYCGSADVEIHRDEDMGEPEWEIRCHACGRGVDGVCPDPSTFRECGQCEHYEPQSPYRGRCNDGVKVAGDEASNHVDADDSCSLFRVAERHRYLGDIDHAMLWKALKEDPSAPLGLMLKMEERLMTARKLDRVQRTTVGGFEAVDGGE